MTMTSWITWVVAGVMIAVLLYAIFSVLLKKPIGLFIATIFHIVLGVLSLPSIGLYVLGLAVIELTTGIIMTVKLRKSGAKSYPIFCSIRVYSIETIERKL